jgi:hypothetical protein
MESIIVCLIICITASGCFKYWMDRIHPPKGDVNEEAWKKLREIEDRLNALHLSKIGIRVQNQ